MRSSMCYLEKLVFSIGISIGVKVIGSIVLAQGNIFWAVILLV